MEKLGFYLVCSGELLRVIVFDLFIYMFLESYFGELGMMVWEGGDIEVGNL